MRPVPRGGVRVLALDGGGTRGLLTIEMLKALEAQSGRRVCELFDVIGGTSTGGILALGLQEGLPLDELQQLYLTLAGRVFERKLQPQRVGSLLLTGATYKASVMENILRGVFPCERSLLERRAEQEADYRRGLLQPHTPFGAFPDVGLLQPPPPPPTPPHAFVVASLVSRAPPQPFLFRNYEYPLDASGSGPGGGVCGGDAAPDGTSGVAAWQALRATTAAPSFFPPYMLPTPPGDDVSGFQDGALMANNPAALALREARRIYPGCRIACVASFGTGEFIPAETGVGSWKQTLNTLVRSATRTEEVHALLAELLPQHKIGYWRFNPPLPSELEGIRLDETRPEVLAQLQEVGASHMRQAQVAADCQVLSRLLCRAPARPMSRRRAVQSLVSQRLRQAASIWSAARSRLRSLSSKL